MLVVYLTDILELMRAKWCLLQDIWNITNILSTTYLDYSINILTDNMINVISRSQHPNAMGNKLA